MFIINIKIIIVNNKINIIMIIVVIINLLLSKTQFIIPIFAINN